MIAIILATFVSVSVPKLDMPKDHPFVQCVEHGGVVDTLYDGSHVCTTPQN